MFGQKYVVCALLGVFNFILQGIWYGPLFGKTYAVAMKKTYKKTDKDFEDAPFVFLFSTSAIIGFIYPLIALCIMQTWPTIGAEYFDSLKFSTLISVLILGIEFNSSMWEGREICCLIGAGKQFVMALINFTVLTSFAGIRHN